MNNTVENKEQTPTDYLIKSLEYGIKALQQHQLEKQQEIKQYKERSQLQEKYREKPNQSS